MAGKFFGLFAVLLVVGALLTARVVFFDRSNDLIVSILGVLCVAIGADGVRAGWKG